MRKTKRKCKVNYKIVLPIITIIFLIIVGILYFIKPLQNITNFANYLSSWSSLLLMFVTLIYVIFTGNLIQETKKQRMHQFNALPKSEINFGIIQSPRIKKDPFNGELCLTIDINIPIKITNIGNSVALFLITKGVFHSNQEQKGEINSSYYISVEPNKEIETTLSFRNFDCEILKLLSHNDESSCPRSKILSILLQTTFLYRNIENIYYKFTNENTIFLDDEQQNTLSNWIGDFNSFQTKYSSLIEKYKAMYNTDKNQARELLDKLEESFYSDCEKKCLPIYLRPIKSSYKLKEIDEAIYKKEFKEMTIGIPINITDKYKEKYSEEINDLIKKIEE